MVLVVGAHARVHRRQPGRHPFVLFMLLFVRPLSVWLGLLGASVSRDQRVLMMLVRHPRHRLDLLPDVRGQPRPAGRHRRQLIAAHAGAGGEFHRAARHLGDAADGPLWPAQVEGQRRPDKRISCLRFRWHPQGNTDGIRRIDAGPAAVRLHGQLPHHLPGDLDRPRELPRRARGPLAGHRPQRLPRPLQLLEEAVRGRVRHGRRVGHRDELPVRHQLERVLRQGRAR